MKLFLIAGATWAVIAAPALADEKYNIVCTVKAMGTVQSGGATINQGFIYSLDFDAKQACERVNNACQPTEIGATDDGILTLPAESGSVSFDPSKNALAVTLPGADAPVSGACRRAPFTAFPAQ